MRRVLVTVLIALFLTFLGTCTNPIDPPDSRDEDPANSTPNAVAGEDQSVLVGDRVTLDATASSDPDGDSLEYTWDLGDGTTAAGAIVTHAYASEGTYAATLTVTDGGGLSAEDNTTIVVSEFYTLSGSWLSLEADDRFKEVTDPGGLSLDDPADPLHDPSMYPNDPLYEEQWNFSALDMPAVWGAHTGSASVVVAVLDTGIDESASDLQGVSFVAGWNTVDDSADTSDFLGHGTHVAGTIAQATNNAYGVAGMAHGVSIMPVRVVQADGKSTPALIAAGIDWAANNGADVINMSIGDPEAGSPAGWEGVLTAIQNAVANGVTLVAASGNNAADGDTTNDSVRYPAAFDEVIAVGGTDFSLNRGPYSNYGTALDIVAPGGRGVGETADGGTVQDSVLQQWPVGQSPLGTPNTSDPTFIYLAGTSQAAPHVAALAALLKSRDPSLTPQQVRDAILTTAIDLGDPGWDQYYGHGLIDPVAALSFGINDYATASSTVAAPTFSEAVDDLWSITADAGLIDLSLSASDPSVSLSLYLYDSLGKLLARSGAGSSVSLQYDVKLQGQEYLLAIMGE